MANVYEAFSFNDRTITAKTLALVTIDFCKTMAGVTVSQVGMTLTELGVGKYVLMNPNITERTIISGYLTTDSTKSFSVLMDPVDGDIAKDSTVAKEATLALVKTETESHPTLAEIEATTILAKDATVAKEATLAIVASYIDTEITTLLNRIGAWTGTGVNTLLGAIQSMVRKDAPIPSDIGGTFNPATDSTEALAETLAAGVTVNPAQFGAGVLQGKVTVTKGETIRRTRGDFVPQGTITFAFGTDWNCTGRNVYFCVRAGSITAPTGPKLLDLLCVLTDPATGTGTLPDMDLEAAGLAASDGYMYEFESVLPDGTKPMTPRRGRFILEQDGRN